MKYIRHSRIMHRLSNENGAFRPREGMEPTNRDGWEVIQICILRFFIAISITLNSIKSDISCKNPRYLLYFCESSSAEKTCFVLFISLGCKRMRMAHNRNYKFGNILFHWNADCSLLWFQVEVLCQGECLTLL